MNVLKTLKEITTMQQFQIEVSEVSQSYHKSVSHLEVGTSLQNDILLCMNANDHNTTPSLWLKLGPVY